MTDTVYIDTKEDCQRRIDSYDNVCSGCGGDLIPIETVDNSNRPTFWAGCLVCSQFDNGVKEDVFKIAQELVVKHDHRAYSHIDHPTDKSDDKYRAYYLQAQIRGTTWIVRDVLRIHKQLNDHI